MRLRHEIDANIKTLSDKSTYSLEDRGLLAEFSAQAYESDAIKNMKVE
jgi:hypothetical protein